MSDTCVGSAELLEKLFQAKAARMKIESGMRASKRGFSRQLFESDENALSHWTRTGQTHRLIPMGSIPAVVKLLGGSTHDIDQVMVARLAELQQAKPESEMLVAVDWALVFQERMLEPTPCQKRLLDALGRVAARLELEAPLRNLDDGQLDKMLFAGLSPAVLPAVVARQEARLEHELALAQADAQTDEERLELAKNERDADKLLREIFPDKKGERRKQYQALGPSEPARREKLYTNLAKHLGIAKRRPRVGKAATT